jgi:hypothetical protein
VKDFHKYTILKKMNPELNVMVYDVELTHLIAKVHGACSSGWWLVVRLKEKYC